jgi:hypothetical protein
VATKHSSITKVETLTLDDVNAWDSSEVAAYVTGARVAVKTAAKADENATDRAAYAMWMAEHVLGIVGKDNKPGKDDVDPGWMTDEKFADTFGRVKSNAGYWRTLGRVMLTLKVSKDSEFYIRLRKSNAYQKPDCKAIIWAESTTPENVEEKVTVYLDKHFDKYGRPLPKTRTPGKTQSEKDTEKASTVTEAVEAIEGDIVVKAQVILAALATLVGEFDVDQWQKFDTESIEALRTAMNDKFAADLNVAS